MLNFSAIPRHAVAGRALRLPLRLIPRSLVVPILQGPLRGARWIVGSATHGCWLGCYERAKQQGFVRILAPGQVVYDLGANVGFYTLLAARRVGPTGEVHAFEPGAENLEFVWGQGWNDMQ
jgi:hypothetical protein